MRRFNRKREYPEYRNRRMKDKKLSVLFGSRNQFNSTYNIVNERMHLCKWFVTRHHVVNVERTKELKKERTNERETQTHTNAIIIKRMHWINCRIKVSKAKQNEMTHTEEERDSEKENITNNNNDIITTTTPIKMSRMHAQVVILWLQFVFRYVVVFFHTCFECECVCVCVSVSLCAWDKCGFMISFNRQPHREYPIFVDSWHSLLHTHSISDKW